MACAPEPPAAGRVLASTAVALALAFGAAVLLGGCPEPESARVAPDPKQRVKLEMARRTLTRIRERRQRGLEIAGDCKTVERLFLPTLRKLSHPKAKALRRQLLETCATDRRDRGARGVLAP